MPVKELVSLGPEVTAFAETFVRHTRGEYAGDLVTLRPFQKEILNGLFELDENGFWKRRHGLVILPRKSGKTMLMSAAATWALYASGEPGCEVYVVAGSKDQARICYQNIRDVVELSLIHI